MAEKTNPRIKDEELYEKLREDGNSKQKSARIANAAARDGRSKVAERGGESGDYEDWTVPELKARTKEIGRSGYSAKKKAELIKALRNSKHTGSTHGGMTCQQNPETRITRKSPSVPQVNLVLRMMLWRRDLHRSPKQPRAQPRKSKTAPETTRPVRTAIVSTLANADER